jgi:ribosome-binding factor A
MSRRTERVNDLLREELSLLIQREVKDPRLGHGLTTITEVQVSPDLRHATVYVSYLGEGADERDQVLRALASASHFLHNELMHRLKMRNVPEFLFRFDPSIERGARLAALIHEVTANRGEDEAGP